MTGIRQLYEIVHANGDVIVSREIVSAVADEQKTTPREVAERTVAEAGNKNILAVMVE